MSDSLEQHLPRPVDWTLLRPGILSAGWTCLILGLLAMRISLGLSVLYGLLFFSAIVLAGIAASRKRFLGAGILILLTALIPPPMGVWLAIGLIEQFLKS